MNSDPTTARRARKNINKGPADNGQVKPENVETEATPATETAPNPAKPWESIVRTGGAQLTVDAVDPVEFIEKPDRDHFFMIHPFDPQTSVACMPVTLFEFTHPGELSPTQYIIQDGSPAHAKLSLFPNKLKDALLVLGQYLLVDTKFVWCLKLPTGKNVNIDKWARTRLQCAIEAQERFITMESTGSAGYRGRSPEDELAPIEWNGCDPMELIWTAVQGQVISDLNHEAIAQFLGRKSADY